MLLREKKRVRTDVFTYIIRYVVNNVNTVSPVTITFVDGEFDHMDHPLKEPYSRFALGALASIEEEVCKLEAAYEAVKT